jgi:hypothetical protein
MTEKSESAAPEGRDVQTIEDFLANSPPGTTRTAMLASSMEILSMQLGLNLKEISLHCPNSKCEGMRLFSPDIDFVPSIGISPYQFLKYTCRNCRISRKTYAVRFSFDTITFHITKLGEHPPFGDPTPTRLLTMVKEERDYYLKGRRSENQGLGIGAYAYYRRVVENQKDRIFDEIIKVAEATPADPATVDALKRAKEQTQFSRAVESLKGALPPTLLIGGHNPLTILHTALSAGVHEQADDECLEAAHTIREVLSALAERVGELLKQESTLKSALSKLIPKKPVT